MSYVIETCKLMGQELDNRKNIIDFDIENGGKFLSMQWDKPMDHDDNLFIANKIAGAIIPEIDFYKNTIHPISQKVLENVRQAVENGMPKVTGAEEYSIKMIKVDEDIEDLVKNSYFKFNYKDESAIIDGNSTDHKPIYKEMETFNISDSGLNRLAKKIFHSGDFINENIDRLFSYINQPLETDFGNIDELTNYVKAFLYAKSLSDEYPVFGLAAKKLAITILGCMEKYQDYLDTNVVILSFKETPTDKTLYVLEETFNKLPNSGELVEALLGLALHPDINSDFGLCVASNIVANKEEYEKRWNLFLEASKYVDPFTKQNNLRSVFQLAFLSILEELPDDVYEYTNYTVMEKERLKIDINNYLKNTNIKDDLDSIAMLIYNVLGEVIFTKTNYKTFIDETMELLNDNDKLTMDDVIVLINAKFITKYLLGKTKTFKIPD